MNEKVLVVDDESLILKSIERALAKTGYTVSVASDRDDFLSRLKDGPFDLAIIDLHMKDLSTDDILETLTESSPGAKTLFISGSQSYDSDNFLQKPFNIGDLRNKVREILDSDQ